MAKKNPHEPRQGREITSGAKSRVPSRQDLRHTPDGREMLSPMPMELPIGYKRTKPLEQQIREMVKSHLLAEAASKEGYETFEEAEDFDIPDDPIDPRTPYEAIFDPPVPVLPVAEPKRDDTETPPQAPQEPLRAAVPKE